MIVTPERAAGFASLASLLRPLAPPAPAVTASPLLLPAMEAPAPQERIDPFDEATACGEATEEDDAPGGREMPSESLLADLRCFRARLAEALAAATQRLTARLAADVLGRELTVAPADVERIARGLLAEFWADAPLRIRVSAHDTVAISDVPVVIDPALRSGDCAMDLADGTYESTLGIRLAAVLEDVCPR